MMKHYTGLTLLSILALSTLLPAVRSNAAEGRERTSFDANWRFHIGEAGAQSSGLPVTGWRWKADSRGLASASEYASPSLDTSSNDWKTAGYDDVFRGRPGFAWFRATLPVAANQRLLHFENVDDNATIYLDGRKVGAHVGWGAPFDIDLSSAWPANAVAGTHVLAVLVENTGGGGGIQGPVTLGTPEKPVNHPEARSQYNDLRWRALDLPHDFVVEGKYDPKGDTSHGFLPFGVGWYRKTFTIPGSDRNHQIYLDFDGIYRNSSVWLNDHLLTNHPSGYTGFRCDITKLVNYGGKNVLAVRADARRTEGWWYEGGGIYRHVWLVKTSPVHVAHWGTFVTSDVRGLNNGTASAADILIRATVENNSATNAPCTITSQIVGPRGEAVATLAASERLTPNSRREVSHRIIIPRPALWSIEKPSLYKLVTSIAQNGRVVDRVVTPFGIRHIHFDAEKGFFLNGRPVKIKGTCNHQDFAGVGVALPDRLHVYKIEKLKAMGSNAYRCSHNPPAEELLDACDRLGMLVMDENRHLGDTYRDHTPSGTPYNNLTDLADMVKRDRNHPSIIMWSMCNEEGLQGSPEGGRIFAAMKNVVKKLDATRPVTCAMNGGWGYGISLVEDLQGCNYNPGGYDDYHRRFPKQPMYGSETASTVSTRGIYANDTQKGYVSAYDVNAPPWAQTAEVAWRPIAERAFVAGGYVWTGFDYRGEPTPYAWPCINSHFGIMDTCGFPKDNYYYYKAWWGSAPVLHILPHWNWHGKEDQLIDVWCQSNCDKVEMLLNGVSLGLKEVPRYGHVEWKVSYAPGHLDARGYKDGQVIIQDRVETAGPSAQLTLAPDRKTISADGKDVSVIAVSVRDSHGRVVPTADNEVHFKVTGPGRILGVGNGDPSSHEPDKAHKRRTFNGLCLLLVQSTGKPGTVQVTAESAGLQPTAITLQIK